MPSGSVISAETGHRPVLLHEALELLAIRPDDVVVDATLGGAGHAKELVSRLDQRGMFIGFDADAAAIVRAEEALKDSKAPVHLINANFRHFKHELEERGISKVTKVLFDLGWSGFQLSAGRGFSFLTDEPLKMTYDADQVLTVRTIVNEWSESSLADIIFGWGEDRFSRRIAKAIVERRGIRPIETSGDLAEIVKAAVPASARFGKTHPATKTFQALRIAVNDEMGATLEGLKAAWEMLAGGGRIAVITFHSIEDRLVKQYFRSIEDDGAMRVTKKPVSPSEEEISENPRSRSAKLRTIEKQNDHE